MKNAVERAIDAVGGPTKASFVTQFSVAQIYNWKRQGFVMNGKAAVLLAQASGVPVEELVGLKQSTATSCDAVVTAAESHFPHGYAPLSCAA